MTIIGIDAVLHYPVNHSENYVNPEKGAHSQTIEGSGVIFLPSRGMKSRDLGSSLGWFMWTRFCSQRKLDVFVHFLKRVAKVRPPSHLSRLPTADMKTLVKAITVNSDEDFT